MSQTRGSCTDVDVIDGATAIRLHHPPVNALDLVSLESLVGRTCSRRPVSGRGRRPGA